MNPMVNTGIITSRKSGAFLGSCFIFRYPCFVLTAQHCVANYSAEELLVSFPGMQPNKLYPIKSTTPHPHADIAVLHAPTIEENDITWPQYSLFNDNAWGEEFTTFGYPQHYSDTTPTPTPTPTPRVFNGYIQRFFNHNSHLGYKYYAAELSIGCPGGLSGAPIFNPRFHGRLFGLVTENIKTSTELETIREVEEDGSIFKEHYHNVINYGVALWLPSLEEWIDTFIPPVPPEEINRRAKNQQKLREKLSK